MGVLKAVTGKDVVFKKIVELINDHCSRAKNSI